MPKPMPGTVLTTTPAAHEPFVVVTGRMYNSSPTDGSLVFLQIMKAPVVERSCTNRVNKSPLALNRTLASVMIKWRSSRGLKPCSNAEKLSIGFFGLTKRRLRAVSHGWMGMGLITPRKNSR